MEHKHVYRFIYETETGRETVYQCRCWPSWAYNGYVYNNETGETY